MKDIFNYFSYKSYLRDQIKQKPARGHGFRTVMAEALQCRSAFISQVLNKDAHFSLEQGEEINLLFQHTSEEADYFLLILQYERSGTHRLRERFKKQIDDLQKKRVVLKERIDIRENLSTEDQSTYYSQWFYAAVHILLTVKKYQTLEALCEYSQLSREKMGEILHFLIQSGLVIKKEGKYLPQNQRLFLSHDSPHILKHHTNWRIKAIQSLDHNFKSDLHYSGVVSLNNNDLSKVKEALIQGSENARKIIKDSTPEDQVYCLCFDFFKV